MRFKDYVLSLPLIIATVSSLTAAENNTLDGFREGRTFDELQHFFKKMVNSFRSNQNVIPTTDKLSLNDLMVPLVIMKFVKDSFDRIAPQMGFTRTSKVLKDDSIYTISELLEDVETSYKDYLKYENETQNQSRSGRTITDTFDYLKKNNKFNGRIRKKFRGLVEGPEGDNLAVAGGIASGMVGTTALGLLVSHMKLVKAKELTKGRSAQVTDDWAIENEIEETVPIVSVLKNTLMPTENDRNSRALKDKLELLFHKVKGFFTENKLIDRFDRLYRSRGATPASIIGGIGAGLIGSLGLGLLAADINNNPRAGRNRALDIDNKFEPFFKKFDEFVNSFTSEIAVVANKNEITEQGRQGKVAGESRTVFHKLKLAYLLNKLLEKKKLTHLRTKIGHFFKGRSPLAVSGGLAASTIGLTGLGLLTAALTRSDNNFYGPEYDASYDEIPGAGNIEYQKRFESPVPDETPTASNRPLEQLKNALTYVSQGPCGQATLCEQLSQDMNQLINTANLATVYKDQLGSYKAPLEGIFTAAKRRECFRYIC
ncbi:uncharacterized protein LOC136036061 [Artemia franciscana]|uniref:Uncharacterized protein n=1 Tax=Artemia franciscana TaxID=6661 RepID=A0AA88I609_ARTSF|nr:hypothetical protein QYM36_004683 [Artemia franciscana]